MGREHGAQSRFRARSAWMRPRRAKQGGPSAAMSDNIRASIRLDKWLWAARFYKTRSLAVEAIASGKVHVNGERAKPAKSIKADDEIFLRKPPYEFTFKVKALSDRRGPAAEARLLYAESAESLAAREKLAAEMRDMPPPLRGRPTKKDRRELERFIAQTYSDDE
jgi:ribosome-associated heat shock protein Hsp15